ncbi:OmpH family outer membrane protein [Ohtaekwangia kribbensis]|uniref:OmpH family outer membrane protein n=1 Tax=Ohtaekwangia kribbensis TaxID=688913 RepID=A0ABW3KAU1_9BACT
MMNQIFCVLMLIPVSLQAQNNQKIGHADWEYIFSHLPEYKQIEVDLKTYEAQLQNQLKLKTQEFEAKYKSYQSLPADTPEAIRKDKESELAYLQENLENFRRNAQASIEKKQHELITPVFTKVGQAIEAVATEHGYSYIINPQMLGGGDVLLFSDQKYNISNLVLQKLGVVPPASEKRN